MANITISEVTNTSTTGPGVFDVLMRSVDAHLDKQYSSGRIKGTEYATVYLGALNTVLTQAIQFVLAEQKAEAEIAAILSETTIKEEQSAQDILLKKEQVLLIQEQIITSGKKTTRDDSIAKAQVDVYKEQVNAFGAEQTYKLAKIEADLHTAAMTQGIDLGTTLGGISAAKVTSTQSGLSSGGLSPPSGYGAE